MTPDDLRARVLYKDSLILVIDKPAGLPVHAGPSGGDNLEAHFAALRFDLAENPRLAHRLDRDTSGCLVLARGVRAAKKVGRLFSSGRVGKTYWAVVVGGPPDGAGTVDRPLKKLNRVSGWRVVPDDGGQPSVTDYRVIGRAGDRTWLELTPHTGRTHQVRVHCALLGCPILGDTDYGGGEGPLHLMARRIILPLYPSHPAISVVAPPPIHMTNALFACGYRQSDVDHI